MDAHRRALADYDPTIADAISGEEKRQTDGVEMIPSENYTYPEVLAALGSVLTNKYAEGYPGRRYYGGQEFTDIIERAAVKRAKALFRAEHANVQPLSGSPMNQAAYFGTLTPGDTVLAMDLSHGGHLTHGAPCSRRMGKVFNFVRWATPYPDRGRYAIDFRRTDGTKAKELAEEAVVLCAKAILRIRATMTTPRSSCCGRRRRRPDHRADITPISGALVAADVMRNQFDAGFDIVTTTTTYKTLRGPARRR